VDIPSGVYCDGINTDDTKVHADHVLSFQFPKAAFLMRENADFIKSWTAKDIGLHQQGIEKTQADKYLTEEAEIKSWIAPRGRFSHKGTYGHLLVMAGSKGKVGAAQLTLKAALKSGAGLLTAYVPTCAYEIIQLAVPEAMCLTDRHNEVLTDFPDFTAYKTIAIGPGIGTGAQTSKMLELLLNQLNSPTVFDADALNILSKNKGLLKAIPANSILTPHPKEFERLAGKSDNTPDQWEKLKAFSIKYQVITVLKGAYTAVADSAGNIYFNNTGNPGMATGGSGDVLTGVVAGLLVSGYAPIQAARMGVYIHGLAGDLAAAEIGTMSLSASDIVNYLGKAFLTLAH
jgi:NAD(P)H-hydrate epimerase